MKKLKSLPLAAKIFLGLALGIVAGVCFLPAPQLAVDYIKPFGTIFLNLIQFIVVPIVFFSIICGVISMKDIKKVGSVGVKTLIYYACTTAIAIAIGLAIANAFRGLFPVLTVSDLTYEAKEAPTIMETIVNIFPSNIIKPFADASMLQVIVASLFFGFAIILVGEKAQPFANFVESINEVCMKIMEMIIALSPIGVFCLITPVVAENGPQILGTLTIVLLAAYIGYILQAVLVYSTTVKAMGGVGIRDFFKGMGPAMMMAFSSASSVGTLPLNLECSEKLGARKDIRSLHPAPGRDHQHGRHSHLSGRLLPLHRLLLRRDPDHAPDAHHHLHRHPGLCRYCGRAQRRHDHAGHGPAKRGSAGGGHRPGGRRGPDL